MESKVDAEVAKKQPQVPTSVVKACREEIDTQLQVDLFEIGKDSQYSQVQSTTEVLLPADLKGYYFIAAALSPPEVQVINGDGMIYRVRFDQGQACLKTRIAKTPCYYADQAIQRQPDQYPKAYHFRNGGPSRRSTRLGTRNQLNTAFLQTRDRLLVTFDAGIPWVIDPETLELIEPVGRMDEWLSITDPFTGLLPGGEPSIFPGHSNPAHPVCDLYKPEHDEKDVFLTINYATGYKGKFRKQVERLIKWVRRRAGKLLKSKHTTASTTTNRPYGYTDLVRYTFDDRTLERWQLVLPDWDENNPDIEKLVTVEQSAHQMAITEKYIILVDMAFKIEFSQIFSPDVLGLPDRLLDWLGKLLKRATNIIPEKKRLELLKTRLELGHKLYSIFLQLLPPSQTTNFYIISREDLKEPGGKIGELAKSIKVRKVTIPREVSHFAADYSNPDPEKKHLITLHIGHNNGTDVTEWISKYDKPVPGKEKQFGEDIEECKRLAGMITGPTDVSSFGRYVIDGETGALLNSQVFSDVEHSWWPSVYTHRDLLYSRPNEESDTEIKNIYWICCGFSWEIVPDRIYQAYKNRDFRVIHHTEMLRNEGKPCKLLRLDTQKMEIVDWFDFPPGFFACSPQFIPKASPCPVGQDPSTHGYIACIVLSDVPDQAIGTSSAQPKDEIWIFDASNFGNREYVDFSNPLPGSEREQSKPVFYTLKGHKRLNIGLTIHSTWLSTEDFDYKTKQYLDQELRKHLREKAFYRDYGALMDNSRDDNHPIEDEPRKFRKMDRIVKNLFSQIREPFSEQLLEK